MDDLIAFIRARLDEEQAWAEGCQGHHWVWECTESDEVAEPNPVEEESLADGETVALRSVERRTVEYASWTLSATTPISHAEEVMSAAAGHIVRHDPARVLAEVDAKRRILGIHGGGADPCDAHDASMRSIPCDTVLLLALPYADHADYREEWRP